MSFSHQHKSVVFHWSLTDSMSTQVSRIPLSILVDLNKAVVCIFSILPLIFNSCTLLSKTLRTVPSALIIISIIVTFMLCSFFYSLARSKYSSIFLLSFIFFLSFSLCGPPEQQIRYMFFSYC